MENQIEIPYSGLRGYLQQHRWALIVMRVVAFVPVWTFVALFALATLALVLLRWALWPLRMLLR